MTRRALVWPLRVASYVGDQRIRRARWTLPPLAPLRDGVLNACHERPRSWRQLLARPLAGDDVVRLESGLVLAPPRPLPASHCG
jgi:hypothetical protein